MKEKNDPHATCYLILHGKLLLIIAYEHMYALRIRVNFINILGIAFHRQHVIQRQTQTLTYIRLN